MQAERVNITYVTGKRPGQTARRDGSWPSEPRLALATQSMLVAWRHHTANTFKFVNAIVNAPSRPTTLNID